MNNVLCHKWGRLYSAEYANRLYRGVKAILFRGSMRFLDLDQGKVLAAIRETLV